MEKKYTSAKSLKLVFFSRFSKYSNIIITRRSTQDEPRDLHIYYRWCRLRDGEHRWQPHPHTNMGNNRHYIISNIDSIYYTYDDQCYGNDRIAHINRRLFLSSFFFNRTCWWWDSFFFLFRWWMKMDEGYSTIHRRLSSCRVPSADYTKEAYLNVWKEKRNIVSCSIGDTRYHLTKPRSPSAPANTRYNITHICII